LKRVLITGATGLIGKEAIQPLLDAGFEVYALTIDKNSDNRVNWVEANIFDFDEIKKVFEKVKPQYLLHFAWITSGDYLTSDINYKLVDASLNMLEQFHKNGGERAVFAGTCFEYEFKAEPLKESDKTNPKTVYAKCKNELRKKAQEYCIQNGISFGWGRIFYVYGHGENEKRLTANVIKSIKEGRKILITAGRLIKDYMYTKDIAGAFVKFLDSGVEGIVNICTGKPVSIKDFVEKITSKIGGSNLVEFIDDCANQPPVITGDNSRLINEVGYKIKYDTDKALSEIIENY